MRYFLHLSYRGSAYSGWQIQDNAVSVQGEIEKALAALLNGGRSRVEIVGCGRTDAGVHAKSYVAHFDWSEPLDTALACHKLNALLPADIAIASIEPVDEAMHARFSARERCYRYFLHFGKDPFLQDSSWLCRWSLDIGLMNRAASALLGEQDFSSFEKLHGNSSSSVCTVTKAEFVPCGDGMYFEIRANRFLRNMVRSIVGTLVDIGRGHLKLENFGAIIAAHNRCAASQSAPARGLFLWEIEY
ncbi:MAG: tRNA pseudouridine(38-40) synthase TruA [Bacteroidales bacterium]|nr:tRNA pseudouridine(38-40) synthase TruA [Bacteroidales bacterium]